MQILISFVTSL